MNRLNFSGHESFQCRELWLKKGFDFVKNGNSFNSPSAVVDLGVGKNMVSAIQYWMMVFNLLDSGKKLTDFAEYIFGENGKDPFLEDNGTLWLLHYQLIKRKHASIYSLFFNDFRKERPEFNRSHLVNYLVRRCEENGNTVSKNTIIKDVGVFLNTYLSPIKGDRDFKDLLSGLLIDLGLVERIDKTAPGGSAWFRVINTAKEDIPVEVLFFCILSNEDYGDSISVYSLLSAEGSIGSAFAINSSGMVKKIEDLTQKYRGDVTYMDDAGIKEVQLKKKFDKWAVLSDYYG
jgi:hypothetical protein